MNTILTQIGTYPCTHTGKRHGYVSFELPGWSRGQIEEMAMRALRHPNADHCTIRGTTVYFSTLSFRMDDRAMAEAEAMMRWVGRSEGLAFDFQRIGRVAFEDTVAAMFMRPIGLIPVGVGVFTAPHWPFWVPN